MHYYIAQIVEKSDKEIRVKYLKRFRSTNKFIRESNRYLQLTWRTLLFVYPNQLRQDLWIGKETC